MDMRSLKRMLSAVLTIMLLCVVFAQAESGNPFVESPTDNTVSNPFVPTAAPTAVPVTTPEPTAAPVASTDANPFDLNTGASTDNGANPFGASADTGANPFGTDAASVPGSSEAGPAIGTSSIPGYNPFDPNSTPSVETAVPTSMAMFVTASTVRIRRQPDETSGTLMTVAFGQQIQVTATQGEWAQIANVKNRTGYCQLKDLSSTDPNTMAKQMYAQFNRLPVYRTPSRRSGKLKWLKQGDVITVTAITSDGIWYRVTDGSKYGFVPTIYLDEAQASQGTPMWCAEAATAVLVNPDNWTEISKLSLGQQVSVVGYVENNTIAKIRSAKGYVAYCSASALSNANPATMNTPVYTQVSGRILFRNADLNGKSVGVGKNARLTLLGLDTTQFWALVKYNGRKYYTPYVLLGPARLGKGYRTVVTTQDTSLYRSATDVAGTIAANTRLYLTGFSGTAAQVATVTDGTTPQSQGFVQLTDIRAE